MCGICGAVGSAGPRERAWVERMAAALSHRGPDDVGIHADDGAVLGNRRLAIIDLEAGHQPLGTADGRYWITYNGEIYNFRELRAELEGRGHRFRTRTDTEVVLHLYREHGRACVDRLEGMFAFAVWDARDRVLFAARDHFGQKPFYYCHSGPRLIFASEIKGLLAHREIPVDPEPAAVDHYLGLRFVPAPLTMVRGIRKLPAAHWLEWRNGSIRVERYWAPMFPQGERRADGDWIAELGDQVDAAVRRHMVSDVPVGALLSGGLDSSLVAAGMARHTSEPVRTFAVGSDSPQFDERPFARQVARHIGARQQESCARGNVLERIPELVRCLDEPSDPIAACFHEAARLASAHVKVVLSGDGGDEMFGGFDRYAAYAWVDAYAALPQWIRQDLLRPILRRIPGLHGYKSWGQRARWLDDVGTERGGRAYARMTTHFRFGPEEKSWVYGPALRSRLDEQDTLAVLAEPFETAAAMPALHRMIYADLVTRFPEHTLLLADRTGMAHGLESRAPLLDRRLADLCARMPAHLKVRRGATKIAARRIARERLPAEVAGRRKQGFMFPVAEWFTPGALRSARRTLQQGRLVKNGWIRPEAVQRLTQQHGSGRADHHVRLWMLLSLESWFRTYVEGEAALVEAVSAKAQAS